MGEVCANLAGNGGWGSRVLPAWRMISRFNASNPLILIGFFGLTSGMALALTPVELSCP